MATRMMKRLPVRTEARTGSCSTAELRSIPVRAMPRRESNPRPGEGQSMEFHRHSPCVRVQRQGLAGRLPHRGGPRCGGGFEPLGLRRSPMESRPAFAAICGSFQTVVRVRRQGCARRCPELPALRPRRNRTADLPPCGRRSDHGIPQAFAARGVTTRGGETIALPSELRARSEVVDPAGLELATDGIPPAFVTKHDRPGGRRMPGRPPPRRRLRLTAGFQCSPDGIPPGFRPFPTDRPPVRRRGVGREGPAPWSTSWSVRAYSPRHSPG